MYARIIVAVDNSKTSNQVLQEGIKLAKNNENARLLIIYVADAFIPIAEGVHFDFRRHENKIRKEASSFLTNMVHEAQNAHVSAESHLIEITEANANIAKKIIAQADKWQADIIVIGTNARKGLSRLLLGSVAEEVIRNTTIPVHIISVKN